MNRLPMICLHALSTTPEPTGNLRFRRRPQPIRSVLVPQVRMQVEPASSRRYVSGSAMTSWTRPAFSRFLIVLIQPFRSLSRGAAAFIAASAQSRAWNRSRTKVTSCPGNASSQVLRIQGAPSDSTTNFLAANRPLWSPTCRRRAPNFEVQLAPSADFALSMRTPSAPLVLSFRLRERIRSSLADEF